MLEEDKTVAGMSLLRLIAGTIEITAALLMLKYGKVLTALRINAVLGLVGPTIFLLVSTLGLLSLMGKVSLGKIAVIFIAVLMIFAATR